MASQDVATAVKRARHELSIWKHRFGRAVPVDLSDWLLPVRHGIVTLTTCTLQCQGLSLSMDDPSVQDVFGTAAGSPAQLQSTLH